MSVADYYKEGQWSASFPHKQMFEGVQLSSAKITFVNMAKGFFN